MFHGCRIAEVLAFLMTWATVAVTAVSFDSGDSTVLLIGLLTTVAAIAMVLLVGRADDLLLGQCRTTRGPTVEEQRLRGSFRRQSHPDTAGRPRPRAPSPLAGSGLTPAF